MRHAQLLNASLPKRPAALCSARLFLGRYPLAASLPGHHQCVAAGAFFARLHQIPRRGGRGGVKTVISGPSARSPESIATVSDHGFLSPTFGNVLPLVRSR